VADIVRAIRRSQEIIAELESGDPAKPEDAEGGEQPEAAAAAVEQTEE
jgi:hypothetical protein